MGVLLTEKAVSDQLLSSDATEIAKIAMLDQ
jgi:hypothetical protein